MPDVFVMYLVKLIILENLYFATNFIKLSAMEEMIWLYMAFDGCLGGYFGSHLGGHLRFTH